MNKKINMDQIFDIETDIFQPANIIQHILQAKAEATKMEINANAVLISDKLYYSKFCSPDGEIPMVCGLKCVYTKELPDDTLFAVVETPNAPLTKDERIKKLESENAMLWGKLKMIVDFVNDNR